MQAPKNSICYLKMWIIPPPHFYKLLSFPLFIYFIYPVHNIFKLSYTFKKLEKINIYSNENIDLPPVEKFCIIVNILKEPQIYDFLLNYPKFREYN